MEAQLQQSIPKKTHQEIVSKMQATIDGLNSEVQRVKGDFQKTLSLNETIAGIGTNIISQNETITSLGMTVASQSQIIEGQNRAIEALNSRLSQSTGSSTPLRSNAFEGRGDARKDPLHGRQGRLCFSPEKMRRVIRVAKVNGSKGRLSRPSKPICKLCSEGELRSTSEDPVAIRSTRPAQFQVKREFTSLKRGWKTTFRDLTMKN